jgi:murein DD-endopeptidase MepM/ murein hydrolase activator NlpD
LEELRQKLSGTVQQIRELETLKNRFMEVATPNNLRDKTSKKEDARGGPWVPPRLDSHLNEPLSENFAEALEQFSQIEVAAKNLSEVWQSQLNWLNALPTGVPVAKDFHMTSGFGIRNDPFTGQMAMHEGLDFVAPAGTPILASAGGTVTRSEWENSFGNVVEVTHIEGFTTRYAHMSKRVVKEGQKVNRGDQLGLLGSTGRSTGPHLHYEVMRHDRVINPMQMLVQASNP